MADLLAFCSRCGKETRAASLGHDQLCGFCLTDDAIAPLKTEYARLWAKRARYLKKGLAVGHCEKQLATTARRLGDQIHRRIVNPNLAIPLINAHLEEVRNQVERPNARIHLPRTGDMLKRRLAIA